VAVEVETAGRQSGQFLLVAMLFVVEHITLDLKVIVVDITKLVKHLQHVQPYKDNEEEEEEEDIYLSQMHDNKNYTNSNRSD